MTAKDFNRCLRMIKDGDNRGMEIVYKNYYEKLVLTARLAIKDDFWAEEIASNVLLSIFKNASHYGRVSYPNAWIYKAVKFAIGNFIDREERCVFTELIDDVYPSLNRNIDFKMDFKAALEKLSQRQQDVVQLYYIYGLKAKDAAKILGISKSTFNREINFIKNFLKFFKNFSK